MQSKGLLPPQVRSLTFHVGIDECATLEVETYLTKEHLTRDLLDAMERGQIIIYTNDDHPHKS